VPRPGLNFDDDDGKFPMIGINPFYHGDASWLKDERRNKHPRRKQRGITKEELFNQFCTSQVTGNSTLG